MMWDDGSEMLWSIQLVLEGRGGLHENGANCNVKKSWHE